MTITISQATPADLDALGAVAPAAYLAAYDYLWEELPGLVDHLQTFGATAFREFLADTRNRLWIASHSGRVVGFLSMTINSPDPILSLPSVAEIPRIYLLPHAHGMGLGRRMFSAACAEASAHGQTHIWLDVLESAPAARAAYAAWGLNEIGAIPYPKPVKPELAILLVLMRSLDPVR